MQTFFATILATIIAATGALAHNAQQLSTTLGNLLHPTTATSVSYAGVPRAQPGAAVVTGADPFHTEATSPQNTSPQAAAPSAPAPAVPKNIPAILGIPKPSAQAAPVSKGRVLGASTIADPLLTPDFVTRDQLNAALNNLHLAISQQVSSLPITAPSFSGGGSGASPAYDNAFGLSQRIDHLDGVTITNPTIVGGSVSGTSGVGGSGGIGDNASTTTFFSTVGHFTTGIIDALSSAAGTINALTSNTITATNVTFTNSTTTNATTTNLYVSGTVTIGSGTGVLQSSSGVVSALANGSNGQVLKISGGVLSWGADLTSGGGSSAWATTTDSLAVYPSTVTNVVVVGASATTTSGNILEVAGNSLFRGTATAYKTVTAPSFTATSSTASQLPYATSTGFSSSYASSTSGFFGNLSIGSLSGFLKATAGVISSALVDLTSNVTGTLPVGNGGTGSTTLSGILKGNGTSQVATVVGGTDYELPLTFNGPLSRAGNTISFSTSGDWTGTLGTFTAAQLIAAGFSTTSADAWKATRSFFATTSNDYFLSQRTTDNLSQGASNKYYSTNLFATDLAGTTTTALAEGSNLYYTPSRVAGVIAGTTTDALHEGTFNLYFTNNRVASVIAGTTTDALAQGAANKYWSNALFDARLSATTSLPSITTLANLSLPASQLSSFGVPFYTFLHATTTDALAQGTSNKYYSTQLFAADLAGTTTTALAEGTNKYYTDVRVQTYLNGVDKGFFFSTTSADAFAAQRNFFSTTSADFLATQRSYFSTSSDDFFVTQRNFFSTTSTNYWKSVTDLFSTTSASFFLSQNGSAAFSTSSVIYFANASTSIAKTYANNTFAGTQTFTNASTTNISSTYASTTNLVAGNFTLGSLTGFLKAVGGVISTALVDLASNVTGILPVGNGGTGWAALAAGAVPYGNGGSALATTTTGLPGQVLALLNGVPTWTSTTTLSSIGGTLGVGSGGTGASTFSYGLIYSPGGTTALANIATSSLGLLTTSVAEGSNLYYLDSRVQSFVHASTTIPKTYTNNTFSNSNIFSGTFTLGSLNGPLDARNGVVGATSSISALYGGTGLTSVTTGDLLYGSATNAWSKLGIGTAGFILGSSNGLPAWVATTTLSTISGTLSGTQLDGVFGSSGILARTGAGTYASRTITGTANQITVANGDGVSGNPTLSLPSQLSLTQSSSTRQSIVDRLYVGDTATTTILGSATSTFGAGIQTTALTVTSSTATSTFANGLSLSAGCFAIGGTCIGSSGGVSLSAANVWTALQQFGAGASTTQLSAYNGLYVGTTATTTILGSATSTFGAGISATALNITSTTATSTFANGLALSGGCFKDATGNCLSFSPASVTLTQVIASSSVGSNTSFTVPTNTAYIVVETWGGGGGGGGSGGTTGAGGTGGNGSQSCFGTNSTACTSPSVNASAGSGGAGGSTNGSAGYGGAGGSAGVGTTGDVLLAGGGGVTGVTGQQNIVASAGGAGGAAPRGGGGGSGTGIANGGNSGNAYGGGGSGGGAAVGAGGGGGGGAGGYAQKTIANPSGTYYYTVGSGGTAGTAGSGTNSAAGAAGGAGGVTIYVYTTSQLTSSGAGVTLTRVISQTSGTNTAYTPPSNISYIEVEAWGAGGGGGGSNSVGTNVGQGGGGYSQKIITAPSGTYYYTVGSGGSAGSGSGSNGTGGGTSCFGTNSNACTSATLQATAGGGGSGGLSDPALNGAAGGGGVGSGGNINLTGSSGGAGIWGQGGTANDHGGTGGDAPRGGGGGASHTGGAGGAGGIVIKEYTTGAATAGSVGSGTQGQFAFYNASGANLTATSTAFLTQSGNFGIGTTTPWQLLSVNGTVAANAILPNGPYTNNLSLFDLGTTTARWNAVWAGAFNVGTSTFSLKSDASSNLGFFTAASGGGTQAMTLTSSGNVGIGTTSPYAALSVNGATASVLIGEIASETHSDANIYIGGLSTTPRIIFGGSTTHEIDNASGGMRFLRPGLVDMNIASDGTITFPGSGSVGIGTANPNAPNTSKLNVNWDSSTQQGIQMVTTSGTFNGSPILFVNNGGGTSGSIGQSQNAVTFNTSSDRRVKENIATTTLGLATLMQLPVRDFDFIKDTTHATTTGFIAQELNQVFHDAVTTNGDNGNVPLGTSTPWSVDYGRITPLIVKAVQDIAEISSTFKTNLIAWLGSASNGIDKLFANEIDAKNVFADHGSFNSLSASSTIFAKTVTDVLCVGTICVTPQQFQAMVAAASAPGSGASNTGVPAAVPEGGTSGPPIIAINGGNPATINVGATYADLGATITAPRQDLNLGLTTLLDGATTTELTLDTTRPGTHTVLYTVTDPKGLTGSASRTVIVSAPANDNAPAATSSTPVATSTLPIAPAANDNQATTTATSTGA